MKALLQQALDALESAAMKNRAMDVAIDTLRAAIAQPESEPMQTCPYCDHQQTALSIDCENCGNVS